jgi:hypothetical protein
MDNKEKAIKDALSMKKFLPFRIHFIFARKQTPSFWEIGNSFTMRTPKSLVKNGAIVELLK